MRNSSFCCLMVVAVMGLVGSVWAAEIQIVNALKPTNPAVDNMSAYFRTFSDAHEANDYHDGDFLDSPVSNAMEIYSSEPGVKSRVNAKPENTPYGIFDLGVKGTVTGDNVLRLRVNDAAGLEYRNVIAYDVNDPNTTHDVPTNGDILEISLGSLVSQTGEYAIWHIETPPLVKGDIASSSGVGVLDGTVDLYDLQALADMWLDETIIGDNYSWGDIDYDRKNNIEDFAIVANHWLE